VHIRAVRRRVLVRHDEDEEHVQSLVHLPGYGGRAYRRGYPPPTIPRRALWASYSLINREKRGLSGPRFRLETGRTEGSLGLVFSLKQGERRALWASFLV